MAVTIKPARSSDDLDRFRSLIRDFVAFAIETFHPDEVETPPVFAKLEDELANLPGKYAEPDGMILLAENDGKTLGCLAGFRRDAANIEVTRLWVKPESRGQNVGGNLVQSFIQTARAVGYDRAVLRSHRDLKAAHRIYEKAGFTYMDGHGDFDNLDSIEIAMARDLS